MNITSIKNRADQLLMNCKPQVMRIMTIMLFVGLIPSLFGGTNNGFISFISLVMTILFMTFTHGYVVSTLKVARNNADSLTDDDAFVGFKRFKDLFPTYLVSGLIIFAVAFVLIFVMMFMLIMFFRNISSPVFSEILTNAILSQNIVYAFAALIKNAPSFILLMSFMLLILIIALVIVTILLFAMPYLLEQYHMTTTVALKESCSLMKNRIWDMVKLELSFFIWILLAAIMKQVAYELLSFLPILGLLIAEIISGLFAIYTYLPKFMVSQAIFFEELAYYRYENHGQNGQGDMHYDQ